ncbi:hypothetical protein FJZ21_00380 [Candidatus Pacearchaeota archaeon]|nr:hypothetical protein [Candidatus Pacearchaeota archaeon]
MVLTTAHSTKICLDTNYPSLEEALEQRIKDNDGPDLWEKDIRTGDFVLYAPQSKPLLIQGSAIRGKDIQVHELNSDELYVDKKFVRRFRESFLPFPVIPLWVDSDNARDFKYNIVGKKQLSRYIEVTNENYGIDRIQIFALGLHNLVNTKKAPFLRQIKLLGVQEGNFNKAGICASAPPRFLDMHNPKTL